MILVCFAVPQEAHPFLRHAPTGVTVLVTGMGRVSSELAVGRALRNNRPRLVLTCGFAGGLNPNLPSLSVVYSADDHASLAETLVKAGAQPATFLCSDHVLISAREKLEAREQSGADAVDMESGHIRALCAKEGIPSATVRVILDEAGADLPLDFNMVMGPHQQIVPSRMLAAIAAKPSLIPNLIRLGRQSRLAAKRLAVVLNRVLSEK